MGCVGGTGGRPTVHASIVSPAGVEIDPGTAEIPAPHDHFAAGPHRRVRVSRGGRIVGVGGYPMVIPRVISAAAVVLPVGIVVPAPADHFATGPYCGVMYPAERRVGGADR